VPTDASLRAAAHLTWVDRTPHVEAIVGAHWSYVRVIATGDCVALHHRLQQAGSVARLVSDRNDSNSLTKRLRRWPPRLDRLATSCRSPLRGPSVRQACPPLMRPTAPLAQPAATTDELRRDRLRRCSACPELAPREVCRHRVLGSAVQPREEVRKKRKSP